MVSIPGTFATALTVSLQSSDTSEVTVPTTVTIPAGQTSALFSVTVVDDTAIDGTQTVMLTASATGWTPGTSSLTVHDNESQTLTLHLPPSTAEDVHAIADEGRVTIPGTWSTDLVVSLRSGDPTEVAVPDTVTVLAGQTSATFSLNMVDDDEIDGTQTVTVTATAAGWTSASASMQVIDNESQTLNLSVPTTATEGDGVLIAQGAVSIPGTWAAALVVALASSDQTETTVPASVTIPSGQTTASFDLTIVDDTLGDGSQSVVFTASVAGWTSGTATMTVADNEVPAPTISLVSPANGAQGTMVTLAVDGTGYRPGATIRLVRQGETDIVGTDLGISATRLTATFALTDAALGVWSVVVANPDGQSASAAEAFEVVLRPQHTFESPGWTMTSVPVVPLDASLESVFWANAVEYGWGCGGYVPSAPLVCGKGCWLLVPQAGSGATVNGRLSNGEVPLACGPGWNMIGYPQPTGAMALGACSVRRGTDTKTWAEAVAAGWVSDLAYGWSPAQGAYTLYLPATTCDMTPWGGWWVLALAGNLTLVVPEGTTKQEAWDRTEGNREEAGAWGVTLVLAANGAQDDATVAVSRQATDGFDGYAEETPKPPPSPQQVSLHFAHPEWATTAPGGISRFGRDLRPSAAASHLWELEVTAGDRGGGKVPATLTWPDLTEVPKGVSLYLEDIEGGRTQYLRTTASYQFTVDAGQPRRFRLRAEPTSQAALRITSLAVTPTRGGGFTVQYSLNKPATVKATIRSAAGRVVATMDSGRAASAGVNTLTLSSRAAGKALPRGVYLAELTACTEDGQAARAVQTFRCQ